MTSVRAGEGISGFSSAIDEQQKLLGKDELSERRVRRAAAWAERLFAQRYGEVGVERSGGAEALRRELLASIQGGASPIEAVWAISRRLTILIGALPGVYVGARRSARAPDHWIRPALIVVLRSAGLKLLGVSNLALGGISGRARGRSRDGRRAFDAPQERRAIAAGRRGGEG